MLSPENKATYSILLKNKYFVYLFFRRIEYVALLIKQKQKQTKKTTKGKIKFTNQ